MENDLGHVSGVMIGNGRRKNGRGGGGFNVGASIILPEETTTS